MNTLIVKPSNASLSDLSKQSSIWRQEHYESLRKKNKSKEKKLTGVNGVGGAELAEAPSEVNLVRQCATGEVNRRRRQSRGSDVRR
jgi:hypothetical protein